VKTAPGYSPAVRTGLIALLGGLLGAGAALGIGVGTGAFGSSTTTQRIVQTVGGQRPVAAAPAGNGFSAARVYAARAPGVVTVFSYFGGAGSQGSGFVVARTGTILTNAHVITNAGETSGRVSGASAVYVEFPDGDRVAARIVGWDVFDDVGVLRVDPADHALAPLPLGRSSRVVVGESVAAIGSPLGNTDSLAVGVVSAVGRSIAALTARFDLTDAIQTDAPLAHGSSGGPLLDARGRVIGINAQIRSDQGGSSGIGFAVPIDSARRSLHELMTKGKVEYAYAGVQAQDLTPSLAGHLGLHVRHGALVDHVVAGGPADRAGIRGGDRQETYLGEAVVAGGDVIVSIGGHTVDDAADLVKIVTNDLRADTTVPVRLVRNGRTRTVSLRLAARPSR
jgi:S1-C subfamily serine protease